MTPHRLTRATVAVLLGATSCGDASAGRAHDSTSTTPSSPAAATERATERITEHGVAAVVADHLGRRVARYGSFGRARDEVSLVVTLRGGNRRNVFMVGVRAPGHPDEIPADTSCHELGSRFNACEELAGGGVAAVATTPYGFSDDNRHGSVLMGWVSRPGQGSTSAMFESYDRTAPLTEQDLLQLLADDRLGWQTSPGVNEAGRTLEIQPMHG